MKVIYSCFFKEWSFNPDPSGNDPQFDGHILHMGSESFLTPISREYVSGSTIRTLLHGKINPKELSLGDVGFLLFFLGLFQVTVANPVYERIL